VFSLTETPIINKVVSKPRTPTALVTTQKFLRLMQIWDRQNDLEQLRQRRGQSLMMKEDFKEKKKL
jgi:chromosome segregation and condensation protein ScpB